MVKKCFIPVIFSLLLMTNSGCTLFNGVTGRSVELKKQSPATLIRSADRMGIEPDEIYYLPDGYSWVNTVIQCRIHVPDIFVFDRRGVQMVSGPSVFQEVGATTESDTYCVGRTSVVRDRILTGDTLFPDTLSPRFQDLFVGLKNSDGEEFELADLSDHDRILVIVWAKWASINRRFVKEWVRSLHEAELPNDTLITINLDPREEW